MKTQLLRTALLLGAALLFVACDDNDTPAEVRLSLDSTELSLAVGDTRTLRATVEPEEYVGMEIGWSTDDPDIASVVEGRVTGTGKGTTTVRAAVAGSVASCMVTVVDKRTEVTGVTLDCEELHLLIYDTHTLTATVTPADATDKTVTWQSDDTSVATVDDGEVTAKGVGTTIVTAHAGSFSARCTVSVEEPVVPVTGIELDQTELHLNIGDTQTLKATVTPEDANDKSVTWESDNSLVATVDKGTVTATGTGTAVVTARAGEFSAHCTVRVVAPVSEPKIGDYFYSDGTWSDGGLQSIEADGLNPVWTTPKPSPVEGKTVIGIVFQTSADRIAQSDRDNGYTHGYVMAVRGAHGQNKLTTSWSFDTEFDCLKNAKTSDVWYWNVNGYYETMTVRDTYGASIYQCPAFDWTVTDFPLEAPASTSGWFLPSTGQLWDMVANFSGHEVAVHMKSWSTQKLNAAYGYASETVDYDVIARFNEVLSQIPDTDKEELFVTSSEYYSTCSIWASTPSTAGETACIINLGTKGTIELYEEYIDGDCLARPILAF